MPIEVAICWKLGVYSRVGGKLMFYDIRFVGKVKVFIGAIFANKKKGKKTIKNDAKLLGAEIIYKFSICFFTVLDKNCN